MRIRIFSIFVTTVLCMFACNCSKNETPEVKTGTVKVAPSKIDATMDAAVYELNLTADCEWGIAVEDKSWVSVSPSGGLSGTSTVKVKVEKNGTFKERSTTIVINYPSSSISIPIVQDCEKVDDSIKAPEGYTLIWHDEFNEGNVPSNQWRHEVQNSGWVNNELQNYRNGTADGKRVTEVKDGTLRINCFKGSDGKIYSGRIYACEDPGIKYGYIEARIKLPKGKGTWPAFWMMPCKVDWANEGWPKCGEIDIMEEVGCVPNEVSSSLHAEGHNHTNNTQVTKAVTIKNAEGEFHTYAIEWTEQNITTYVDGAKLLSYNNDGKGVRNWPYSKEYYIILNLAWGGSWGGMKGVDANALPVTMEVDYVRVFQKL